MSVSNEHLSSHASLNGTASIPSIPASNSHSLRLPGAAASFATVCAEEAATGAVTTAAVVNMGVVTVEVTMGGALAVEGRDAAGDADVDGVCDSLARMEPLVGRRPDPAPALWLPLCWPANWGVQEPHIRPPHKYTMNMHPTTVSEA